jgi:hypothetical protein
VKRPKPFSSYTALMCDLLEEEPTCSEEAIQRKEWVDAMTKEYQSMMKNKVWEIVPKSKNKDGVSYMLSTKLHYGEFPLSRQRFEHYCSKKFRSSEIQPV